MSGSFRWISHVIFANPLLSEPLPLDLAPSEALPSPLT